MVKQLFILVLCFGIGQVAHSQEMVIGMLLDSTTAQPIEFAHVSNITDGKMTVTNLGGYFRIPASEGDTIVFSIVGYQTLGWEVRPDWFGQIRQIRLLRDTTLLNEVIVNNLPSEEIFKKRILDFQPDDTSFWYHGIPKPKPYDNSPLTEKQVNNPLFAITQPTDFLYEKFSKQAKEKRKYHRVLRTESREQRVYEKFNREWIGDVTGLEGDLLTSFIQYCDYSIDYLDKTPLYVIQEDMLAKLSAFQKLEQG